MKIAWFSPLPPQKSGIAHYSELIIYELKKYAKVDLWVNDLIDEKFSRDFKVINYKLNPDCERFLNDYTIIIFNMGNDAIFHSEMFEVLKKYKGIVILHDYVLHHFFYEYWLNKKRNPMGYIKEMQLNYGEEGRKMAEEIISGKRKPVFETEKVIDFPLNLSVLKASEGIIAHSEFVKKRIQSLVKIPIKKLNHPHFNIEPKRHLPTTVSNKRFRLFFLGEVGFNRQINKIIEIIGNDEVLKNHFLLIIVGKDTTDYAIKIKRYIEIFGLMKIVNFLGYHPPEEFEDLLETADLCLGLRYPTMGETSGAVMRYLSAGKPTLVNKVGWYDELPDEIVIKIDPGKEREEITSILHNFLKDPKKYRIMGQKAKEYVKKNFSLDGFVQGLLEFIDFVNRRKVLDSLIDKVSSELISMNLIEDKYILYKISKELYNMFKKVN